MTVRIREGDLARDRLHYLAFIDGLQEFEHRIEPVLPGNTRAEAVYRRAGFEHYAYDLWKYLR